MSVGILSYGGYVPKARLQRGEILKAHAWFNPGLRGLAKGERAMANWDEDAVTMAVEAAQNCLEGQDNTKLGGVFLGSTSFPFRDRQNAGIIADALTLPKSQLTLDLSSSQRAGSSALITGLMAAKAEGKPMLVVGSEKRPTKPASPLELTNGDGAAALLVGEGDNVIADYIGGVTEAVDFVDHFRGEEERFDYQWEERWVRDEGYMKLVPAAMSALFEKTGLKASEINHFCFPAAMKRVSGMIAKKVGIAEEAVADNLQANVGETGAAHPLVMLVHALETAKPGDVILVAGFGQGTDVMAFRATQALTQMQASQTGIAHHLECGRQETRYSRFLAFNDLMDMERGIRAEVDKQTGLSTLYRNREMTQALVGGKCTTCGTKQYPKQDICVNPNCNAVHTQIDEPFAHKRAKLNSYTADQLTYTPDPPTYFGMIQFEEGGRLMSDFTDIAPGAKLEVGCEMRMVFRVKDFDPKRGFRRYFWKATPVDQTGEAFAHAAE